MKTLLTNSKVTSEDIVRMFYQFVMGALLMFVPIYFGFHYFSYKFVMPFVIHGVIFNFILLPYERKDKYIRKQQKTRQNALKREI